jgi:hypothetical protein
MKQLEFTKDKVRQYPLKYWEDGIGTLIDIYQGNKGENPKLYFIVKYREKGKRLRQLSHIHWYTDLLLKCENNKELVHKFLKKILYLYETTKPFDTVQERDNYELNFYKNHFTEFVNLDDYGHYKIENLSSLIELFIRCEKQTKTAFKFKTLLNYLVSYCEGTVDMYTVQSCAKRV